MSQLIEDLLKLSKMGQSAMHRARMDLSRIAERLIAELQQQDPSRNVSVQITPNLTASGDERLITIALENLLHNAWKFTRKTASPSIEFGSQEKDGQQVFFVKDNGAGFGQQYTSNLFGVFQRFHPVSEFEGTGIGLAIVRRVIERHGGKIWAESKPDEGATFFFTLS
jgi:light-regulated signal transduction histidine kinase (bacteriophytochrome)